GNGENTALQLVGGGSVSAIDFSSLIVATDADGDAVQPLLAGDFTITVVDDEPVRVSDATPISGTVDEAGMSLATGGLSEGNKDEPGETNASDETSSLVAGSLANLVSVGADEPAAIGLSQNTDALPALLSQGQAVTYEVTDANNDGVMDTLTATA